VPKLDILYVAIDGVNSKGGIGEDLPTFMDARSGV